MNESSSSGRLDTGTVEQNDAGGLGMKREHTPGPWVVDRDRIATIEPRPQTMLTPNLWAVAFASRQREGWEANAALIAAAPELLAALREARAMLIVRYGDPMTLPSDNASDRKSLSMFGRIDAAIAKAIGAS